MSKNEFTVFLQTFKIQFGCNVIICSPEFGNKDWKIEEKAEKLFTIT
jgi:hypothetical protein